MPLTLFSGWSVESSAAVDTREVTPEELHSLLGDELSGSFYDAQGYKSCTFKYLGTAIGASNWDLWPTSFLSYSTYTEYTYLLYRAPIMVANDPALDYSVQVDVPLTFSGSRFQSAIGFSLGTMRSSDNFNYSHIYKYNFVNAFLDGQTTNFSAHGNASSSASSQYGSFAMQFSFDGYRYSPLFRMIPFDSRDHDTIDVKYLLGSGISSSSDYGVVVAIMCPLVSSDGDLTSANSPSGGSGSSGGDIHVDVNVDMSETNGLLGKLIDAVASLGTSILNGIKNLFIPTEEDLISFTDSMRELAQNHLGGLYQAFELLQHFFDSLTSVSSKDSITIPACNIPLAGETLILGPYDVPLKVSGIPAVLYEGIAFIIDFHCTAAFINMCKKKFEIFLNPDSEVVQ